MGLTLAKIPGFTDISDTPLTQDKTAFGIHVAGINDNAAFGMVRPEIFQAGYSDGQTVALPSSPVDGYNYSRDELMYVWAVYGSENPKTGWISGKDSLWYAAWKIDQVTGAVSCNTWYRVSGSNPKGAETADGILLVFTIAQRARTTLTIASPPSYSDLADGAFYQDAPYKQTTARTLSHNSKFGAVEAEVVYMGEFTSGQTVPQPVSPVDGHTYAYSAVKFAFSWRWTTIGSVYQQPPNSVGQMGPMKCAINASTGVVSLSVAYIDNNGSLHTHTEYGRVAVFAFCQRTGSLSFGAPATAFAEVTQDHFFPGNDLQASVLSQVNKNCREAAVTPEFFGPVSYHKGDAVPVPTSPVDGHVYARAELFYIYEWDDNSPETGSNLRLAMFSAAIDPSNGVINMYIKRMPPGGPYQEANYAYPTIRVITVGMRTASNSTVSPTVDLNYKQTGAIYLSPNKTGGYVKIIGPTTIPTKVTAALLVQFMSATSVATDLTVVQAAVKRTLTGSNAVVDSYPLTFGGAAGIVVSPGTTFYADLLSIVMDPAYDYYVFLVFSGYTKSWSINPITWTGKVLASGKLDNIDQPANPTTAQFMDVTDVTTYLTAADSDQDYSATDVAWTVTSVVPPADAGSQTGDQNQNDTINGT